MEIESAKFVYFSPTGTTKAIVQNVASGFDSNRTELIDITKPGARETPLLISKDDLVVIAVPVYMGRVPALITEWLNTIQLNNAPTVCIAVYGNRDYDDALLELKNIVTNCSGVPIAYAAYIGEHSFSTTENPVAQGRPDEDDLHNAKEFGQRVSEKLQSISSITRTSDLDVPGVFPYRRESKLWDLDFIAVNDSCVQCGICAENCPVGAIDSENSSMIDQVRCITCCACIRICPQNARSVKPSPIADASIRLNNLLKERKMPVCFL